MRDLKRYTEIVDNDLYSSDWMSYDYRQTRNVGTNFWSDTISDKFDAFKLVTLSKYLRAVSNFVKIMTRQDNISVKFASNDQSYTDGKNIVISKDISDGNFDIVVGLALHESSHILKTDMEFFRNMINNIGANTTVINKLMLKYNETDALKMRSFIFSKVKDLTNIIEDRRCDDYVYKNAPGYMVYYRALYNNYYITDEVSTALLSDSFTDENWSSYLYRTLFIMNPNTILTKDKLVNLEQIYNLIDLKNISRLTSIKDSYKLALEIFNIIENSIIPKSDKEKKDEEKKSVKGGDSGSGGTDMSDFDDNNDTDDSDSSDDKNDDTDDSDSSDDTKNDSNDDSKDSNNDSGNYKSDNYNDNTITITVSDLSDDMKKSLKKIQDSLNSVKKLIDGNTEKEQLTSDEKSQMSVLQKSNVTFEEVGDNQLVTKRKCVFVKKLTQELVKSKSIFNNIITNDRYYIEKNEVAISKGIKNGIVLGKQLQIRTEQKELKFTRLQHGKIDKRLLHELGFNDGGVFFKKVVDKFNDVYIHITVDASGSMNGNKWYNTLTSVTSIAKACSMISGIHLTVSFRNTSNLSGVGEVPFIIMSYDSKVNKITQITTLWKYLYCGGCTPEGLTFETITNIFPMDNTMDKFFVNFSDGAPYCNGFSGSEAVQYTKNQVRKITNQNIEVISYFISERDDIDDLTSFRTMYGKNSENIDVTSIIKVAKSLNNRFLKKSVKND